MLQRSSSMRQYLLSGSIVLAFVLFSISTLRGQSALHPLEGTWNVTVTPDNDNSSSREYQDTWTITLGDKFTSETMKAKGFADGQVDTDTTRFGPTKFNVTIKSDKDGSAKYQGTAD